MDNHTSKMRQVLREDGLDKFPEITRGIDRLNELARKLTSKNLHVTDYLEEHQWSINEKIKEYAIAHTHQRRNDTQLIPFVIYF